MTDPPSIVIGTGPSGVAAAAALIRAGHRPLMIDGGRRPDAAALSRQAMAREGLATSSHRGSATRPDPGQKAWFDSRVAFAQDESSTLEYAPGIVARASYGVGGLSRVWGGTFSFASTAHWPPNARPDRQDLALVSDLVPSSTTVWPPNGRAPESGQVLGAASSGTAMTDFARHGLALGWTIQPATVAIDTRVDSATGCHPCGQCLTGCPRDSIWFSGDQVDRWFRDGSVDRRSGFVVHDLVRTATGIDVRGLESGAPATVTGSRVFLAAGALSSAAILITSGVLRSVTIPDTATAFGAIASRRGGRDHSGSHGLSQWWVGSPDGRFAAQVYPPSPEHAQSLAARLPARLGLDRLVVAAALHLMPMIAYLDSDLSDPINVSRDGPRVRVSGSISSRSTEAVRHYVREIAAIFRKAGYWLPAHAVEITAPGTGYHFGASMPHGAGTDILGSPAGWERLHIVDSSVLPRLEVGSITPTVMANAARIARVVSTSSSAE